MLLIILILFIALFAILANSDYELAEVCGGAIFFILCVMVIFGFLLSGRLTIDDKIALYEEENKKIESEVALIVENYKKFEYNTFTELKTDSIITLVTLFPELKSNELVNRQLDLYIGNNNEIKSLKESRINKRFYAWWLYFGK